MLEISSSVGRSPVKLNVLVEGTVALVEMWVCVCVCVREGELVCALHYVFTGILLCAYAVVKVTFCLL